MSVQPLKKERSIREQVSAEEWQARIDLACAHRVLWFYGVRDLTYNHLSLRVPGEPDHFLIKPTDEMFEEVTASSLIKYDFDGNPVVPADARPMRGGGLIIHGRVLRHRQDLNCIFHTHTPAVMGVSAHKWGLLPINQHAMRFYGEITLHEFKGFEFEDSFTDNLLKDMGDDGKFMLLQNHGSLICGETVAECVVNHHWLEMACQGQVAAVSAGEGNFVVPSKESCEFAHSQFERAGAFLRGGKDWQACLRLADRLDPGFRE